MSAIQTTIHALVTWAQNPRISKILEPAGIILLADISVLTHRTAQLGGVDYTEALLLTPSLYKQHEAHLLNRGEYPACAALTSGYVFRVENQATVYYMQRVSRKGCLALLSVTRSPSNGSAFRFVSLGSFVASTLTLVVAAALFKLRDGCGLAALGILVLARAINITVIRRRVQPGWSGASEPGVNGDILVLLSQDRWVRIKGSVDDLKLVLSGSWMRETTLLESGFVAFSTLLVYFDFALMFGAELRGRLMLVALLVVSAGLIGLESAFTSGLVMHGCRIHMAGPRKKYVRRRDLADELIAETKRDDWAVRLGMVLREDAKDESEKIM